MTIRICVVVKKAVYRKMPVTESRLKGFLIMNDEKMILPANYQCINTEEMEHIYGGEYKSVVTTLSAAKEWVDAVLSANYTLLLFSGLGTFLLPGAFAFTDIYAGYNSWRTRDVYNNICKWESQYGGERKCILGANFWNKMLLGLDCELA